MSIMPSKIQSLSILSCRSKNRYGIAKFYYVTAVCTINWSQFFLVIMVLKYAKSSAGSLNMIPVIGLQLATCRKKRTSNQVSNLQGSKLTLGSDNYDLARSLVAADTDTVSETHVQRKAVQFCTTRLTSTSTRTVRTSQCKGTSRCTAELTPAFSKARGVLTADHRVRYPHSPTERKNTNS